MVEALKAIVACQHEIVCPHNHEGHADPKFENCTISNMFSNAGVKPQEYLFKAISHHSYITAMALVDLCQRAGGSLNGGIKSGSCILTPLALLCSHSDEDPRARRLFRRLMSAGADPDGQPEVDAIRTKDPILRPLLVACRAGNLKFVEGLLQPEHKNADGRRFKGANPNFKFTQLPLAVHAALKHNGSFSVLVKAGMNLGINQDTAYSGAEMARAQNLNTIMKSDRDGRAALSDYFRDDGKTGQQPRPRSSANKNKDGEASDPEERDPGIDLEADSDPEKDGDDSDDEFDDEEFADFIVPDDEEEAEGDENGGGPQDSDSEAEHDRRRDGRHLDRKREKERAWDRHSKPAASSSSSSSSRKGEYRRSGGDRHTSNRTRELDDDDDDDDDDGDARLHDRRRDPEHRRQSGEKTGKWKEPTSPSESGSESEGSEAEVRDRREHKKRHHSSLGTGKARHDGQQPPQGLEEERWISAKKSSGGSSRPPKHGGISATTEFRSLVRKGTFDGAGDEEVARDGTSGSESDGREQPPPTKKSKSLVVVEDGPSPAKRSKSDLEGQPSSTPAGSRKRLEDDPFPPQKGKRSHNDEEPEPHPAPPPPPPPVTQSKKLKNAISDDPANSHGTVKPPVKGLTDPRGDLNDASSSRQGGVELQY